MAEHALKERQKTLEVMGISVHNAGIGVDKNKYYLVSELYFVDCTLFSLGDPL
jgi:hypothetical protein